ncbi:MAG: DUF4253 domain-containing protein [Acidimicrobiia bacterium]
MTVLPEDGPVDVAGVHLPSGRRLHPDDGDLSVLWATDEPLDDGAATWWLLHNAENGSSVIPLLLSGIGGDQGDRPWDSGEFDGGNAADIEELVVADLLARWWEMGVPDPEEDEDETAELLSPFTRRFPGLAPAEERLIPVETLEGVLAQFPPARLGLVVADSPADALSVLGWRGATNYDQAPKELSAVLRSWQERFGATLVGVGFDTVHLLVTRPPRSRASAVRAAAEHYAFCLDSVVQGAGSISALADELIDAPVWSFWWD